jgi:hypothetical protein
MSLEIQPGKKPLIPPPPPLWGEVTAENEVSSFTRFVLSDRIVTFPVSELRRWEFVSGENERLIISAGRERVVVEGVGLAAICVALENRRLREVRASGKQLKMRPGAQVHRVILQSA